MYRKKIILLGLSLFAVIRLNAQFFQLDLPFVRESMQPEMFLFEPHYDSQNRPTHYTLGHFFKVHYTWNEKQLPASKTMYTWNQDRYEWAVAAWTNYTYDPSGKLTEERTTQPYSSFDDPQWIKTTVILKQVSKSADAHTDTIREYGYILEENFLNPSGNKTDALCRIRYLNREGMPDSIMIGKGRYGIEQIAKNQYTYDDKKRIVRMKTFHFLHSEAWKLVYTINVGYEDSRISYTITYPNTDTEEKKAYPNVRNLLYTLTFDKQNQIASANLKWGNTILLDAAYRYDPYGNTLVSHTHSLNNPLLNTAGFIGEIPDEWKCLKYTIDYEKDICKSLYYTDGETGKKIKFAEMQSCYSPDGALLSCDLQKYSKVSGTFDERERKVTTYKENGREGESIFYRVYDLKNRNDLLNFPKKKILFKTNDAGQKVYEEVYQYESFLNKGWVPKSKKECDYDANGYEKYVEEYVYFNEYIGWIGKLCSTYVRDDLNRICSEERKKWNPDLQKWEDYARYAYRYNANNKKTLKEEYTWDPDKGCWEGLSRDSVSYGTNGDVKLEIGYAWLKESKEWEPLRKMENRRDSATDESIYFEWKENQWQPIRKSYETISELPGGNYFSELGRAEWSKEFNGWEIHYLEKYERVYPADDHMEVYTDEFYSWDDETGELEGTKHVSTQITYLESGMQVQKSYSLWNQTDKSWEIAVRHTHLQTNEDDTYTLETYDKNQEKWIYEWKVIKNKAEDDDEKENALIQSDYKEFDYEKFKEKNTVEFNHEK